MILSQNLKSNKGFTLIEVLMVVAIIAILGGIVLTLVNSSGIRGKARDSQRISDLMKMQAALEQYYANYRYYPPTLAFGSISSQGWIESNQSLDNPLLSLAPDYIESLPIDPEYNSELAIPSDPCSESEIYRYNYVSNGNSYILTAILENPTIELSNTCTNLRNWSGLHCEPSADGINHCYGVENP
jgi:prepilin-type N-terminal cleavage/methylation domain-containing protein